MENQINNKKRQVILSTAKELFWKYGFKRVSIEEICKAANVSKMTFYKFFPNKLELAKTVFDGVIDKGLEDFKSFMAEEITPSERIKKMLLMKQKGTNDISREFLQDFYNNPELGLKTYIEEKTKSAWDEILNGYKIAQEDGWFRKDIKPELLFSLSQKLSEILIDENLLKLYRNPQELIMEIVKLLSYGFVQNDKINIEPVA